MQWIFHAFDLNENRLGDTWKMQLASNGNIFGQNSINFLFFFFSKNLVSTFQRESACRGKFCIFIHFTSIKLRLLFESALPLRIDWNTRKYRPRKIGGRCLRCVKFLIFEGIQLALESKSYSKNSENQDWCTKGQALCSKISWKYFQAYQDKPS